MVLHQHFNYDCNILHCSSLSPNILLVTQGPKALSADFISAITSHAGLADAIVV